MAKYRTTISFTVLADPLTLLIHTNSKGRPVHYEVLDHKGERLAVITAGHSLYPLFLHLHALLHQTRGFTQEPPNQES